MEENFKAMFQVLDIDKFSIKNVYGKTIDRDNNKINLRVVLYVNVAHTPNKKDLVRDVETGDVYKVENVYCPDTLDEDYCKVVLTLYKKVS